MGCENPAICIEEANNILNGLRPEWDPRSEETATALQTHEQAKQRIEEERAEGLDQRTFDPLPNTTESPIEEIRVFNPYEPHNPNEAEEGQNHGGNANPPHDPELITIITRSKNESYDSGKTGEKPPENGVRTNRFLKP
ncbi:hypothetical protein CPC08DRAFT_710888 [Agrocybe pediades]|nr:hypothetical protein CPC08DRAFT_710888 [Agrocybe pediades]